MGKLNEWLSSDPEKKFGKYAALGASQACDYASEFANDHTALLKINDYNWLRQQFDLLNKGKNNE
jgi:hypothetical protein